MGFFIIHLSRHYSDFSTGISVQFAMAPPKILISGDVLGRLNQLFKRVSSVNKSAGPFDALLCVGQFFPDTPEGLEEFDAYLEGRSRIPIPTYFIGDYGVGAAMILSAASKEAAKKGFKMDGFKVCENLFWLKGSGKFTLHGLSIAYLAGRQSSSGLQSGTYSQDDVDVLRALAEEPVIVDFFMTNEWPSGVTNRAADVPSGISDSTGTDSIISELVAEIKPRYHIAGTMGVYYDREPYTNDGAVHVTRFIGLAPVGNKDKQKFIHAISPNPASTMSSIEIGVKPPNTTLSPYILTHGAAQTENAGKRSGENPSDSQYWRYDVTQKKQKYGDDKREKLCFKYTSSGSCPHGEKCHFRHDEEAREQSRRGVCFDFINKGKCEKGSDCKFKHSLQEEGDNVSGRRAFSGTPNSNRSKECWFCLSSPNVESHLIISIEEYFYCALAKGPLVEDHVLIIPVEHLPNTMCLPGECEIELGSFQNRLKSYFRSKGKEAVFFEWVSKKGTHANLQVVPVPSSRASGIQNIFNLAAKKLGFKFKTIECDASISVRRILQKQFEDITTLFYVELPGGSILYHDIEENEKFPIQFGREVLAGLLNMADRADWRNCKVSKEEETTMAETFKQRFEDYEPSR